MDWTERGGCWPWGTRNSIEYRGFGVPAKTENAGDAGSPLNPCAYCQGDGATSDSRDLKPYIGREHLHPGDGEGPGANMYAAC